jgi:hypothetical protein
VNVAILRVFISGLPPYVPRLPRHPAPQTTAASGPKAAPQGAPLLRAHIAGGIPPVAVTPRRVGAGRSQAKSGKKTTFVTRATVAIDEGGMSLPLQSDTRRRPLQVHHGTGGQLVKREIGAQLLRHRRRLALGLVTFSGSWSATAKGGSAGDSPR